jgi:hypothetical protein
MKLQRPDGTLALHKRGPIGGPPKRFQNSRHEFPAISFASLAEPRTPVSKFLGLILLVLIQC